MRAAALALALFATPAAAFECHTALILALDASKSVDPREYVIQRHGLADALKAPEIMAALSPAPGYGAYATAIEWSDPGEEALLAPWTRLDGPEAITAFAERLRKARGVTERNKTGLGQALIVAAAAARSAPGDCRRTVIDVSGDGPTNAGPSPAEVRAAGHLEGLTINGLVIRHPSFDSAQPPKRDPLPHYQQEVIQGPGRFIKVIGHFADYAEAIREKLERELSPPLAALE